MGVARALGAGAVALLGAWVQADVRRAEQALLEDRSRVADALAASEAGRSRAERLARAGSLVARATHDMSSPLAVVRANVHWLGEMLDDPGAAPDRGELREVLGEVREATDRLAREVAALRAAARASAAERTGDPPLPGPERE